MLLGYQSLESVDFPLYRPKRPTYTQWVDRVECPSVADMPGGKRHKPKSKQHYFYRDDETVRLYTMPVEEEAFYRRICAIWEAKEAAAEGVSNVDLQSKSFSSSPTVSIVQRENHSQPQREPQLPYQPPALKATGVARQIFGKSQFSIEQRETAFFIHDECYITPELTTSGPVLLGVKNCRGEATGPNNPHTYAYARLLRTQFLRRHHIPKPS